MQQHRITVRWWYWLVLGGLYACQSMPQPEILPPPGEVRQYHLRALDETSNPTQFIVVSERGVQNQWRWLLLDALGAPRTRQIYLNGRWQNDGFLPLIERQESCLVY
ncbi:hypothetical protein L0B52_04755 [Suttonella sp. R2A3]|uniref:hypothetical protein n=1 Tax=Suttonella sp. R2A3 TaxID=2908648 RepID=UPI001F4549F2|nr:hypothetical protein [Suttonella sp. R2A3]UJF23672.1 hypothetical protein L0B52_04755 [Suttonella sp. R2A3]